MAEQQFDHIRGHKKLVRIEGQPVSGPVDAEELAQEVRDLSTKRILKTHRARNRIGSGPTAQDRPHRHVSRRGDWNSG